MNQKSIIVDLINKKEQLNTFYQQQYKIIQPVFKGLLALVILIFTQNMFQYEKGIPLFCFLGIALLQAFIPISFLHFFAAVTILYHLWGVSIDIFVFFLVFILICFVVYVRLDNKHAVLAVIVPVLFYWKIGFVVPVVLAFAIGIEALFPTLAGIFIYYFSITLNEMHTLFTGSEALSVGNAIISLLTQLFNNKVFLVVLLASTGSIILTALLYKVFHERAWILSMGIGSVSMALLLLLGRVHYGLEMSTVQVLLFAVLSVLICIIVEFFREIGDVSRMEKTVFEDDEYIYYVKAVPKMKVAQSEQKHKIINQEVIQETNQKTNHAVNPEDVINKILGKNSTNNKQVVNEVSEETDEH